MDNSNAISGNKILKALELILADVEDLRKDAKETCKLFQEKYENEKDEHDIKDMAAKKIIKKFSDRAGFWGGATALTGVIPGLGTLIATFGGSAADIALLMKYQVEMVMEIATVYDYDITQEEIKNQCLIISGLAVINNTGKKIISTTTSTAFVKIVKQYLKGATLQTVKQVFKTVGVKLTQRFLIKIIPFGVGVVIGSTLNKLLTIQVGKNAQNFFSPS